MARRRIHGLHTENPDYAVEVYEYEGKVWLVTPTATPASFCMAFTPEQWRELCFAGMACAEIANDHRALQQQVQRPDLATQVAMGELL